MIKISTGQWLSSTALAFAATLFPTAAFAGTMSAEIRIDASKPGVAIPPHFCGLMTEEINHAYDGGLYAELIKNRTFQDNAEEAVDWSVAGAGEIELTRDNPVNAALPVSLKLTPDDGHGAVANDGFWGIPVKPDTTYTASFYVRGEGANAGPVTASIVGEDQTVFATAKSEAVGTTWKKVTLTLKTQAGVTPTTEAQFVLSIDGQTPVHFSYVSLFPPTYKNAPNGLRPDLMKLMAGLKPSFIRLPGGNYLEGNDFPNRFDWKRMIGKPEDRPGHQAPWGYRSSDGMGLPEFMLWCRQLNAEPILAVFAGYTLNRDVVFAGPKLQPYVDEALEEIEYFTGGPDTKWGKKRIEDGITEPFKLQYVEVGNEDWFDPTPSYDGRFAQFYDAIKKKYPELKVIATMPVQSRRADLVDDHYYLSPRRMAEQGKGYRDRPRDAVPVFLGEWAAQIGNPTPTLKSGLGDAAFLCELVKDSDIVPMQCYAPLLVNVNEGAAQWGTNLIGYDAMNSFGSPSYYAQVMFNNNLGDHVLPASFKVTTPGAAAPAPHGAVGVGSWRTQVEYKDLTVTGPDGKTLTGKPPTASTNGWKFFGGDWNVEDDAFTPANGEAEQWATVGNPAWTDYTVRVKVKKTGGDEGFIVMWHAADADNYHWFNVGGWGNTSARVEHAAEGERQPYGPDVQFKVEDDKWYDLRLEVKGDRVKCFVDDRLVIEAQDGEDKSLTPVYLSAEQAGTDVLLKVVNFSNDACDATVDLGYAKVSPEATATVLVGDPKGVNTVDEPMKIAPKTESIHDASAKLRRTFPANSFTVLRLKSGS